MLVKTLTQTTMLNAIISYVSLSYVTISMVRMYNTTGVLIISGIMFYLEGAIMLLQTGKYNFD